MSLVLDPRAPVVWRDTDTLQFGVDRPSLVLSPVSRLDERVVAAVAAGHGAGGLPTLVAHLGADPAAVAASVGRLRPALVAEPSSIAPSDVVLVAGPGPVADAVAHLLGSCGVDVRRPAPDARPPRGATGVLVGGHVVDPGLRREWVRSDVTHLLVRVGDRRALVGPVTVPGATACARCLDLHAGEADRAWPAIAGQLSRRALTAPPSLSVHEIASRAARRLWSRLDGAGVAPDDEVESISIADGLVTRASVRPHPECGCAALPRSDSPVARRPAPDRTGSTTAAAVRGPS
ncbi:bacteriocin biosynthesis cyclodehydratase domain-containing protein [Frigoribacterium sp. PvP054]